MIGTHSRVKLGRQKRRFLVSRTWFHIFIFKPSYPLLGCVRGSNSVGRTFDRGFPPSRWQDTAGRQQWAGTEPMFATPNDERHYRLCTTDGYISRRSGGDIQHR